MCFLCHGKNPPAMQVLHYIAQNGDTFIVYYSNMQVR